MGTPFSAMSKSHFHATDAGVVEAWAVYYGMKLALEAFFYRIDVETDSAMQCGSRAPARPEPSIGHIVDDIKALISSFEVSN